jgi:hypothetical protein
MMTPDLRGPLRESRGKRPLEGVGVSRGQRLHHFPGRTLASKQALFPQDLEQPGEEPTMLDLNAEGVGQGRRFHPLARGRRPPELAERAENVLEAQ